MHTVYIKYYITLHFIVPDKNVQHIAYDNLF